MALSKAFERELDNLFRQRTHWLRQELGTKKIGAPPKFSRKKVNTRISTLQDIASKALAHKLAKVEFEAHVAARHSYHIKGHGYEDKKERFEGWFSKNFKSKKGFVYTFWTGSGKCIYVGRTGSGGSRPSSHFDKFWFPRVSRVTIFSIRGKSHIPELECLAIHHFQPVRNKNRAATKKWTKACPLCATHRYIEDELRDIFRLRH